VVIPRLLSLPRLQQRKFRGVERWGSEMITTPARLLSGGGHGRLKRIPESFAALDDNMSSLYTKGASVSAEAKRKHEAQP
jgi:hypothetical protein